MILCFFSLSGAVEACEETLLLTVEEPVGEESLIPPNTFGRVEAPDFFPMSLPLLKPTRRFRFKKTINHRVVGMKPLTRHTLLNKPHGLA